MREWRELRLYFRAMADVRRLRMVAILAATGEVGVKELCAHLRASQPLVSLMLNGKRELSKASIRKLAAHFRLEPSYFL